MWCGLLDFHSWLPRFAAPESVVMSASMMCSLRRGNLDLAFHVVIHFLQLTRRPVATAYIAAVLFRY